MYDQVITERRLAAYQKLSGNKPRAVPVSRVREIVVYLEGRTNSKGEVIRPAVTPELKAFIENERAMCKASFRYWADRYAFIEFRVGHGGIDLFQPLESQLILLEKLAKAEVEMWERKDAGDTKFLGLCFMIHKARQLGFTTLCQLLLLHLALFWGDRKTISASVDDQKTIDMHAKWNLAYERLPFWQQVEFRSAEKDRGKWLPNGSYCALQDFSQKGGLGQGMTWSAMHATEIAAVPDEYCKEQIQNHLLPALSDALGVIGFMESTAQGAGNWWHQFWLQVDSGRGGRWQPAFIPAYAEPGRWSRAHVPDGWEMKEETRKYESAIIRTSPKYMNGRTVRPTKNHLFWWEEERQIAIDTGTLNLFLANYCVTPEESFQYASGGAFNPQIITGLDNRRDRPPVAYELVSTPGQRQAVRERVNNDKDAPRIFTVGSIDIVPIRTSERDVKDPRGLLLFFEPPRVDVQYSIGADPAVGLVGWDRRFRSDTAEELNKDNACASGWYREPESGRTCQAFEFCAPINPRDFATYLYALGKLYSGANGPERGAPIIIELNNGGSEVQNTLMQDLRYYSIWQRTKFDGVTNKQLEQWGWMSNLRTVQELWVYTKDSVEQPSFPIRPQSEWLLKEMALARWDPLRRRGEVPEGNGQHDDRIVAMMLALWQLRGHLPVGSYGDFAGRTAAQQKKQRISFQDMDIGSLDEYNDAVDSWYDGIIKGW